MNLSGNRGMFFGIGVLFLVVGIIFLISVSTVGGIAMLIGGGLFLAAAFGSPKGG